MSGSIPASAVPALYDVVVDGFGYITARAVDPNMPFRVQQQSLSYTPTFLERTNVSGNYGDDSQAFFLTASQNDWSEGEDQRFFRSKDTDSIRRYWLGSNIDITIPGQATLRPAVSTLSLASAVTAAVAQPQGTLFVASTTNLYEISTTGTITDRGAHGAGILPPSMCTDGVYLYISGNTIRRYDTTAHTFSAFSAASATALTFAGNTLWGATGAGAIHYFDTAGTGTAAFTWKTANGSAIGGMPKQIVPLGGQIVALLPAVTCPAGAEIWIGDTTGFKRLAALPLSFTETAIVQVNGILFIAGFENNASYGCRTVIYYVENGTLGRLWWSPTWNTFFASAGVAIAPYKGGLLFTDIANGAIRFYDFSNGGTSVIAPYTVSANPLTLAGNNSATILTQQTTSPILFPSDAAATSSGFIVTSLFDFDNSLAKLFRGIKVDYTAATDGDGGSVDIAYQVDSLDGSFTTLQTGAVSGTEYAISGVSGHSISVKLTIKKGTSTLGPVVKRVYVRGVPILTSYRINEFILDLGGDTAAQNPVVLRDGLTPHPLTGEQQRVNLVTALTSTSPISVTDRTGTFTAVLEPANCEFDQTRPGQWYARIRVREV